MTRRGIVGVIGVISFVAGMPHVSGQSGNHSPARATGAPPPKILVDRNLEARMRDGVILRADVYRPDVSERLPALLERTPYSKNPGRDDAQFRRLAEHGYVVVVQDTRGRYMSDGIARPHDEAEDGYDTIEWVAGLPWVVGRVGTFGGSYSATTQLIAAPLRPPHLVAMVPTSSYNSRYDMVFQGGAFYLADGLAWNLGQGADVRRRILSPEVSRDGPIGMTEDERQMFANNWLWHVPLQTIDAMELRRFAPAYFDMLKHPSYDEYWKTFDIEARHGEIDVPAYHLTGWYDSLLTTTVRNFTGLRQHARSERARAAQRLIIGPWTHSRPTLASTKIGDVDFGPDAGLSLEALTFEWFDYWLKGSATGVLSRAPVRLFVMGTNVWRDEQEWPLARATPTSYYLHSGGHSNTLNGDGSLGETRPATEPVDRFIYVPWNPVATGQRGGYSRAPADQRDLELRSDVLVYTTPPLPAPLEVTGPIEVRLWASSSAPDTDFTAKLVDVFPDGTARALSDGILRARYRGGKTSPVLLTPGEQVEISSSNFPRFDRNPNTGAAFAESSELRRAEQTILHDAQHPSRLVLPVVRN